MKDDAVADGIGVPQVPSEYHWYAYGEVPPDGFAASVIDCPASIVGALGDIAPAEREPFTVTVTGLDATISGGDPLSLTCSSNDQIPVVDTGPVGVAGLSPALQTNEAPRLL